MTNRSLLRLSVAAAAASASLVVGSTTAVAAPSNPAPAPVAAVQYQGGTGSSVPTGSLGDPLVQSVGVIAIALAVSAGMALAAGIAGGAIELPELPF